MTRTIHLITRCSPSKHPEIVEVALRGEFGTEVLPCIFTDPALQPPPQPMRFEFPNEGEAA